MLPIRQSATHKVLIGPVVAVGDGFTPVTTLSLSTADEAEALVHDSSTVVDISGYTWAAVTTADGYYVLTLQSGISGTVGHMTVLINDDSLCLPVRADFMVLDTGIYDSIYADGAGALATAAALTTVDNEIATIDTVVDGIQTDLSNATDGLGAIKADTAATLLDTAVIGALGAGLTALATQASVDALNDAPAVSAATIADAVWDEAQADHVAVGSFGITATEIAAIPTTAMRGTDNAATAAALATAQTAIDAIPTTAMRGTDNAALASVATELRLAELDAANLPADIAAIPTTAMRGTDNAATAAALTTAQNDLDILTGADGVNLLSTTQTSITNIEADTNELQVDNIPGSLTTMQTAVDAIKAITDLLTLANINAEVDTAWTTAVSGTVSTDGALPTREQAVFLILQLLSEIGIAGTTMSIYGVDGTTPIATLTLDDGTNPTALTRAT